VGAMTGPHTSSFSHRGGGGLALRPRARRAVEELKGNKIVWRLSLSLSVRVR